MDSNSPTSSEPQESSPDENETIDINAKVRNALSLNAWHAVLQASCKFITGVLADVSSGRRLLHIKNPYKHLFFRSSQDLKNLEPLQPSIYTEIPQQDADKWIPRFKFLNAKNIQNVNGQVLTEDMKLNMLEQQLTLMIHASRCVKRQQETLRFDEYAKAWPKCTNNTPYCHLMRGIFQHLVGCRKQPGTCNFGFCEPAKRIISHFKNCPGRDCSLCSRVAYLLPAKPRVRRNAIDDVDFETYMARISRPRTESESSLSNQSTSTDTPENELDLPSHSGFERVPAPNLVLETIDEDVLFDEPIITLNDGEAI